MLCGSQLVGQPLRSATSTRCHSAPSPAAQLAPTAEANEFKQLRFPAGSCNTNSSELLDPDFLWDSCSHLQHASWPREDELAKGSELAVWQQRDDDGPVVHPASVLSIFRRSAKELRVQLEQLPFPARVLCS